MRNIGSVVGIMICVILAGCGDRASTEELQHKSESFVGSKHQYGQCEVEQKRFYYSSEFSGTTFHYVYIAECPTATVTTTIQQDKASTPVSIVVPKPLTAEQLLEIQKNKALAKLTPEEQALLFPPKN